MPVSETLRSAALHPILRGLPRSAVLTFDHDLRFLSATGPGLSDLGLSAGQIEGKTIFEIFAPSSAAAVEAGYRLALAGGESTFDVPHRARISLQRLGPLRNDEGEVVAGVVLAQDVTEARRSERILRQSEARFQQAFERAPIGKALINLDLGFDQVNEAMCDITGYSELQLRELSVTTITHPGDLSADLAGMAQLLTGAVRVFRMEERFVARSGELVWVAKSVSLLRGEHDVPLQFVAQIQDISDRKRIEQDLAQERRRLHDAQSIGRMGSWELDIRTGAVTWSDALLELRGLTRAQFEGHRQSAVQWVHPEDRGAVSAALTACGETGEPMLVRYRATRANDGTARWFDARGRAQYENGERASIVGTVVDVTEDVLAEAEAIAASAFQRAVIKASPDLTFVYDAASGTTIWSNRSLTEFLGRDSVDSANGAYDLEALIPLDERQEFEDASIVARGARDDQVIQRDYRLVAADGTVRWFSRRTVPLRRNDAGVITQFVGVLRDITDAVAARKLMEHSALHDGLTGLPNRILLIDRLEGALLRTAHDHREVSVLYCDLDGFKRVNDTAGHAAGDTVLLETARRLRRVLRDGDTVARVGGDEFVIVIEPWDRDGPVGRDPAGSVEVADRFLAPRVADRIRAALHEPIIFDGLEHVVSASIGIAYGSRYSAAHTVSAESVIQEADTAMYRAKSLGKDRFEVFRTDMRTDVIERARIETVLRQALRTPPRLSPDVAIPKPRLGSTLLTAAYQPIFDSGTGNLTGFEALARLTDADGTDIRPDVFISVAEDTGIIRPLGILMLDLACGQLASWRLANPGLDAVTMSVNVSALQARHSSLADDVRRALGAHRLQSTDLVLELTETALLQASSATIANLGVLHDEGVGIAIDDFGTGYASLRYLATLPVSALKIDRTFTARIPADKTSLKIVGAVAGLAADLELSCVVEGIETAAQLAALPAGVQLQGYLLGRPARPDKIDLPLLIAVGASAHVGSEPVSAQVDNAN